MKQILYSIFGILVVLMTAAILIQVHFSKLAGEDRETLIQIDQLGEKIIKRKELMRSLEKWNPNYDRIARTPTFFIEETSHHFGDLAVHVEAIEFAKKPTVLEKLKDIKSSEYEIIQQISRIGFKEFGAIGYMRRSIHQLEAKHPEYRTEILALRREEKDFLMRNDDRYKVRLDHQLDSLESMKGAPNFSNYRKSIDYVAMSLSSLWERNGLFERWAFQTEQLQHTIRSQRSALLIQYDERAKAGFVVQVSAFILLLVTILLLGYLAIRLISNQVKVINLAMESFIFSNYDLSKLEFQSIPRNEIGLIARHFMKLARKIHGDMQELEGRVARRTASLDHKNQLLLKQHQEMLESLSYARDIQQAIMTSREKMSFLMPETHVFYAPKEQVGGDFFWMKNVNIEGDPHILFALADCTGHGVPGALLSMIGLHFLDDLFGKGIHDPSHLLQALREKISQRLRSENGQRRDGMDIALFSLNLKNGKLIFSGAQMPLWIVRKREIHELPVNKQPVGFYESALPEFRSVHFQLETGDLLFLFTDGLVDQFGGDNNKKWGKKRLRELLCETNTDIFNGVSAAHYAWKQDGEQTDDCTFITIPWVSQKKLNITGISDQNEKKTDASRSVPRTNVGNVVSSLGASTRMVHLQKFRRSVSIP